jgi:hypothetical protein
MPRESIGMIDHAGPGYESGAAGERPAVRKGYASKQLVAHPDRHAQMGGEYAMPDSD